MIAKTSGLNNQRFFDLNSLSAELFDELLGFFGELLGHEDLDADHEVAASALSWDSAFFDAEEFAMRYAGWRRMI